MSHEERAEMQARDATWREQSWRDQMLARVVDRFPARLTPNHLTRLRIGLVLVAIMVYIRRAALIWQVALLLAATVTDLFDGPLARRRGLSSPQGARLDRYADSLLTAWLAVLSLLEAGPPPALVAALVVGQVAVLGTQPARRLQRAGQALAAPRPTLAARLQLGLVVLGFWLLLGHAALGWRTRRLGEWLLLGGLGATGARLVENLQAPATQQTKVA